MADKTGQIGVLRDAVVGDKDCWKQWGGCSIGGITYPPCLRKGNLLRIFWQVGDPIVPMEPLLLYRYVCQDGKSFLELCLSDQGIPIINKEQENQYGEGKREGQGRKTG